MALVNGSFLHYLFMKKFFKIVLWNHQKKLWTSKKFRWAIQGHLDPLVFEYLILKTQRPGLWIFPYAFVDTEGRETEMSADLWLLPKTTACHTRGLRHGCRICYLSGSIPSQLQTSHVDCPLAKLSQRAGHSPCYWLHWWSERYAPFSFCTVTYASERKIQQ